VPPAAQAPGPAPQILTHAQPDGAPEGALRSSLAEDQDIRAFLPTFVADLPAIVTRLEGLLDRQALGDLRDIAHQLKGTGGVYGFAKVTDAAARIESDLDAPELVRQVTGDVRRLIDLIRSVEGYQPAREPAVATPTENRS
jgi:HPt (histidine-containing phosphotransfer) domain-containing protein